MPLPSFSRGGPSDARHKRAAFATRDLGPKGRGSEEDFGRPALEAPEKLFPV
jgi:hypothetical protein